MTSARQPQQARWPGLAAGTAGGFSLVELMVASAVLAITGAAALTLMTQMFFINTDSRLRSQATAAAQEAIDTLFGVTVVASTAAQFDRALNSAPSPLATCGGCGSGGCSCTTPLGEVSRTVTIGAVQAAGAYKGMQNVTVTMAWGNRGVTRTAVFGTALVRP